MIRAIALVVPVALFALALTGCCCGGGGGCGTGYSGYGSGYGCCTPCCTPQCCTPVTSYSSPAYYSDTTSSATPTLAEQPDNLTPPAKPTKTR
jgi:hypothetical protein